jgi:predicted TIM-barrel fold metal-dependent hydrolase
VHDIVDAQVHLFAEHSDRHPWDPAVLADPSLAAMRARFRDHAAGASPEAMLALMDRHGVQGALVVAPAIYGNDLSYSRDAYTAYARRFRVVGRVDAAREDLDEALRELGADPGVVGIRLNLWAPAAVDAFLGGRDDRLLAGAARAGLRLCVNAPGRFDLLERIARTFPDLPLIVDHVGLFSVAMLDPGYGDTFAGLDGLLKLAAYEQVSVKLTSLPLLSREPYPHADVWPHVHRVIAAFGPERLMWGSDQTVFDHDYGETIDLIRATDELSPDDKAQILGASLRRVWGWPAEERRRGR